MNRTADRMNFKRPVVAKGGLAAGKVGPIMTVYVNQNGLQTGRPE